MGIFMGLFKLTFFAYWKKKGPLVIFSGMMIFLPRYRDYFYFLFHDQLRNEKNPGCLGYVGDYTTQLHGDYNDPY